MVRDLAWGVLVILRLAPRKLSSSRIPPLPCSRSDPPSEPPRFSKLLSIVWHADGFNGGVDPVALGRGQLFTSSRQECRNALPAFWIWARRTDHLGWRAVGLASVNEPWRDLLRN